MQLRSVLLLSIVNLAIIVTGCAARGIVQTSPDTYTLSRTDKSGIPGNASKMKADVIREADEFAANQGKIAIPLSVDEKPIIVGARFASIEYQFRVADKTDPAVKSIAPAPSPVPVIGKTEKVSTPADIKPIADIKPNTDEALKDSVDHPKDLYTKLIQLDDLRKRGILTQAEFEAQKKKVLNSN